MRIVVFGAGGVGGYFGGRLAQAGEDVVFVARGAHLNALQTTGLKVDSLNGDFHIPVKAVAQASEAERADAVLIAVKGWQVPEAARAIVPLVQSGAFAVTLENGVDAPDMLVEVLGREPVLAGLCRIFSWVVEPGHIRHAGVDPSVVFGELDNNVTERATRLRDAFTRARVIAVIPPDIHVALWEKLLFISSTSGVGALIGKPLGQLRHDPESRAMIQSAMQEIWNLARAKGVNLADDTVSRSMGFVDRLPAEATTSMQRDILEGRPSELEVQSGTIVRLGKKLGVPTPTHERIYNTLLPLEQKARANN